MYTFNAAYNKTDSMNGNRQITDVDALHMLSTIITKVHYCATRAHYAESYLKFHNGYQK